MAKQRQGITLLIIIIIIIVRNSYRAVSMKMFNWGSHKKLIKDGK